VAPCNHIQEDQYIHSELSWYKILNVTTCIIDWRVQEGTMT